MGGISKPVFAMPSIAPVRDQAGLVAARRLALVPQEGVLQALAALMGASEITILTRAAQDGATQAIASTAGRSGGDEPAIPETEHDFVALRELRWFDRGPETAALAKLIERRDMDVWATLTFDMPISAIRNAMIGQMPTFVSLLAAHAATLIELAEERLRARAISAALDQRDGAVFVLRRDQSVLFANKAAHQLLERKAGLHLSRTKLRPPGYRDAVRFETAIDHVIDAAQGARDDARTEAMLLLLPMAGGGKRLAVSIAPAPRDGAALLPEGAAAIVSVQPIGEQGSHGVEAVCQAYALSPVEGQLVCHLVAGRSVSEAATRMRVKVDTARAYLKQVFAKTETHRQASLLQLIAQHQSVVQGDHLFAAA